MDEDHHWQASTIHANALQRDLEILEATVKQPRSLTGIRLALAELRHLCMVVEQTHEEEQKAGQKE